MSTRNASSYRCVRHAWPLGAERSCCARVLACLARACFSQTSLCSVIDNSDTRHSSVETLVYENSHHSICLSLLSENNCLFVVSACVRACAYAHVCGVLLTAVHRWRCSPPPLPPSYSSPLLKAQLWRDASGEVSAVVSTSRLLRRYARCSCSSSPLVCSRVAWCACRDDDCSNLTYIVSSDAMNSFASILSTS